MKKQEKREKDMITRVARGLKEMRKLMLTRPPELQSY